MKEFIKRLPRNSPLEKNTLWRYHIQYSKINCRYSDAQRSYMGNGNELR